MTTPSNGMLPVKVPANLPELVKAAFNRARASGDVHFFPTQVTLINVNSIPFQLRYSPALANKPQVPQPSAPSPDAKPLSEESQLQPQPKKKPFFDPFDNPAEAMLVTPLAPNHNLVLNKFAIVPEHFILATRAFKEQTDLLERDDLEAAYACIEAYHHSNIRSKENNESAPERGDDGSELYVFFNSGAASGSSQPHRHIQMLPVERMREGLSPPAAWEVLADELLDGEVRRKVPFSTFAERIGPGADLMAAYLRLYRRACQAVLGSSAEAAAEAARAGEAEVAAGKAARVDYNLAMTRDIMVVAPRVIEGTPVTVAAGEDGKVRKEVGKLALNGTVLAGTALVKSQAEWDALRAEPEQLLEILGRIGVPTVQAPPLL
ncbi:hypothetical protein VTI28DRAFT_2174 [Corynascus sepedonium]